jgi:hypothetical protein
VKGGNIDADSRLAQVLVHFSQPMVGGDFAPD